MDQDQEIFCRVLNKRAPALSRAPKTGKLGEWILSHVSEEAWALWLEEQTKLMNEYRLDPLNPDHRRRIHEHMFSFLAYSEDA